MRIGTFIAQRSVQLTPWETAAFNLALRSAFEEYGFTVSDPARIDTLQDNSARFRTVWNVSRDNAVLGVNEDGDRLMFESLKVEVYNNVDKEGNLQFSAWCSGDMPKNAIIYSGCREINPIMPDRCFQYGTEVQDFAFDDVAFWLYKKTLMERSTPGQLRKIAMALRDKDR